MNLREIWASDAQLVERVRRGRLNDFDLLVKRYLPMAHAIAFAHTGNRADAEDVAQDAFVKAYENLDSLRDARRFGAWFGAIVRNTSLKLLSRHRREERLVDEAGTAARVVPPDLGDSELRELLHGQILRLAPEPREILLLHYYAGKTLREIAAIQEISRDAAAKRLQRAREALSERLLGRLGGAVAPEATSEDRRKRIMGIVAALPAPGWLAHPLVPVGTAGAALQEAFAMKSLIAWLMVAAVVAGGGTWIVAKRLHASPAPATPASAAASPVRTAPAPDAPSDRAAGTVSATAKSTDATAAAASPEQTGPGSIELEIINVQGRPAEGATAIVELVTWEPYTLPPAQILHKELVADEAGHVRAENLPLGDYSFIAYYKDSIYGSNTTLTAQDPSHSSVMRLLPSLRLWGTVTTPSGEPVAGAAIYPTAHNLVGTIAFLDIAAARVASDAEGRFEIPRLFAGTWDFSVAAPGRPVKLLRGFRTDSTPFKLVVGNGGFVSGRVVALDGGQPLARVAVRGSGPSYVKAVSDASGDFRLGPLNAGAYDITVEDPILVVAQPVRADVTEGEETTGVTVQATPGAVVSGQVRDVETQQGVADWRVVAYPDAPGLPSRDTRTDVSGRYVLQGLGEGRYTVNTDNYAPVQAFGPGGLGGGGAIGVQPSVAKTFTLRPGDNVENIDFEVHKQPSVTPQGTVTARVIDIDGSPAEEVHIAGSRAGSEEWSRVASSLHTDTVTFGVPWQEPFLLVARTASGASEIRGPFNPSDEALKNLEFRITRRRASSVSGQVIDGAGRPVPNALIWAAMSSDPSISPVAGQFGMADASGHFSFGRLHADTYTFNVASAGTSEAMAQPCGQVTVGQGETVNGVQLVYGGGGAMSIAGRVVDRAGRPIQGAIVSAATGASASTGPDGTFRVVGIPEETTQTLHVSDDRHSYAILEGVAAGSENVTITLEELATVEGRVVDASGMPVTKYEIASVQSPLEFLGSYESGQYIELEDGRRVWPNAGNFTWSQDPEGRFRLTNVQQASNALLVRAPGYVNAVAPLERVMPGGTVSGVEIRLEPGCIVEGTVVDPAGNPVGGASVVTANAEDGTPGNVLTTTRSDGTFRVEGLSSRQRWLGAADSNSQAYATGWTEIAPTSGAPTRVTIRLLEWASLEGVVVADGQPASNTLVQVEFSRMPEAGMAPEVGSVQFSTDAQGFFRAEKVAPATYSIVATLTGPDGTQRTTQPQTYRIPGGQTSRISLNF